MTTRAPHIWPSLLPATLSRLVSLVSFVRVVSLTTLVVLLLLAGCVPPVGPGGGATTLDQVAPTPEALLARMTLEQKVGQLLVVSFNGTSLTAEAERMVRDYHVGGVILFQQNLTTAAQIRELTAGLQSRAALPLLMAVDQEGGPVARITGAATLFPSEMAMGATYSPEAAAKVAGETAKELRALGFNVNFAPVMDVNSNPRNPVIGTRAYGADPALVGRLGSAAIGATQAQSVLAVAKHFPGHGDADVDSHRALPSIEHPLSRLESVELPPFKAAIAAGVDGIMTAHLLLPALEPDPKRSATLSPAVLSYLREQLGYKGLIVTDDLEMGAVVNDYGTAEAAKLAFQAGADVLLFRRTVSEQQRAHALLVQAVRDGEISQARLDASVKRILEAKARRGLLKPMGARRTSAPTATTAAAAGTATGSVDYAAGTPPLASAQSAALDVARQSLTLVKNTGGVLPLKLPEGAPVCVVYPRAESIRGVEVLSTSPSSASGTPAGVGRQTLGEAVQAVWPSARLAPFSFRPSVEEREEAEACVRESRAVILGSYNLREYPAQATFLKGLIPPAREKPSVVAALRLPYDLAELEPAPALLATYSVRPASLQASAEAIFGKAGAPAGHLPVPVSAAMPLGHGLLDWSRPNMWTG